MPCTSTLAVTAVLAGFSRCAVYAAPLQAGLITLLEGEER